MTMTGRRVKREAARLFRFCLTNGVIDETRARFVARHVATSNYRRSSAVLAQFMSLLRRHLEGRTARIESAAPLTDELRSVIGAGLTRRYGPNLATTFTHRPSLIGGVRIQVGSDVYDGSIQARLNALARSF